MSVEYKIRKQIIRYATSQIRLSVLILSRLGLPDFSPRGLAFNDCEVLAILALDRHDNLLTPKHTTAHRCED